MPVSRYVALRTVKHSGQDFPPGTPMALSDAYAAPLLAVQAIEPQAGSLPAMPAVVGDVVRDSIDTASGGPAEVALKARMSDGGVVTGVQPPSVMTYLASQLGGGGGSGFTAAGWVNAADAGITGSGDEGAKLNTALAAAANKVFIIPSGMTITSSVPIDVPSNIIIDGRGATLKSACPGLQDRLLRITGKDNVTVVGLTLDGDKANYPTHTEHRHNVFITESTNVRLLGVTSRNAKGDGIYVGSDAVPSRRVYLTQVMCEGNYRNGLAIVSAVELVASSCIFRAQVGYHPQAGLDIEGNTDATLIDKISISSCMFTGNVGYGAMVSFRDTPTVRQGGVTFSGCHFDDSPSDGNFNGFGLRLHNARDTKVIGGTARGNNQRGITVTGLNGSDVIINGVEISGNQKEGFGIGTSATTARLTIANCNIHDNGLAAANTYDAIYLAYATGALLMGNQISGSSSRYGLRADTGTTAVRCIFNTFGTFASGSISDTVSGGSVWIMDKDAAMAMSRAAAGDIAFSAQVAGDTQPRFYLRADGDMRFGDGASAPDVRLYRSAVDTLRTNDSFTIDQVLTVAKSVINTAADGTGYIEMREQSADPAAPVANQARIFFRDNGSGKTQLCVRFNTGAIQVLATEPYL